MEHGRLLTESWGGLRADSTERSGSRIVDLGRGNRTRGAVASAGEQDTPIGQLTAVASIDRHASTLWE